MPDTYRINTVALVVLRKAKGFSQQQIAELLVMDRSNYGKIERGETELSFRIAFRLAEELGIRFKHFVHLPAIGQHHETPIY